MVRQVLEAGPAVADVAAVMSISAIAVRHDRMRVLIGVLMTIAITAAPSGQGPALSGGPTPNTMSLPPGSAGPAARVADLAWLAGTWTGEGLGGQIDEVWSAPGGDAMVGYFRLIKDGKPVFYQILTLLESEGSVEMRLKHVNPDMTGWEEKNGFVTFRLVKHDETGAYFSGLTFRRRGRDAMDGYLALRDGATNTVREEKFVYRRVK